MPAGALDVGGLRLRRQPGVDEKLIRDLATLRFLDDTSNVLFVGPPGVGKTMLSVAPDGPPSRPATASTSPPPPSRCPLPQGRAGGPLEDLHEPLSLARSC
ncbi:ATP-binding protein [Kitasatospora purpeofusca]|uniref:ATP-binding protein n=1 Tax=Kitasatospora purpeofusca TaxID=67352 RepID=UPI0035D5EC4E